MTVISFEEAPEAEIFRSLFCGSQEAEAFVFFTDPHLFQKGECSEEEMLRRAFEALNFLRDVYISVPADFIIGGGDWLGSSDTVPEAKKKLGIIDGCMRELFADEYYPVLGNHDTNYQGVDENGRQLGVDRALSPETLAELCFKRFGRTYYSFEGKHTRFYVTDSQLDWNATEMNPYKFEQLHWLAGELIKNDDKHSAIVPHMWWWNMPDDETAAMTKLLGELICAYNKKSAFICQGTEYDFTDTKGRIEFVMSGHSHGDWETKAENCPVFSTTLFRGKKPTFDLMYADYSARKLYCIRIGDGESRVFNLDSGNKETL